MKKVSFFLLSVLVFTFSACKKKSNPPSIVGKWAMTDLSGIVIQSYSTFSPQMKTLTYNSSTNTLTITSNSAGVPTNISTIIVSTENWEFKVDGTYTINETFTVDSYPTETSTTSGTWAFLSNTRANNSIVLLGSPSMVISEVTYSGGAYNI